jgi:hypothetical protein
MAYAQTQGISDDDATVDAARGATPLRDVNARARRTSTAELREIESLRAINAHLLREIAAMKAR